jgi:hypothetical protein
MSNATSSIRTDCWEPGLSTKVEAPDPVQTYPVVCDVLRAGNDLVELIEESSSYEDLINKSSKAAEEWLNKLESTGNPKKDCNAELDSVAGLGSDPRSVTMALRDMRKEILLCLQPQSEGADVSDKNFPEYRVAKHLYKHIGGGYEYLTASREFWVLISVYVLPDVVFRWYRSGWEKSYVENKKVLVKSNKVAGRFAIRDTFQTRDSFSRLWWKYHSLTASLAAVPSSRQYNNNSDSVWQERVEIYCYPPVVKYTANNPAGDDLAKRLGAYLVPRDGHNITEDDLKTWHSQIKSEAKSTTPPSDSEHNNLDTDDLIFEFAKNRLNVENGYKDGLSFVRDRDRLEAYLAAMRKANSDGYDSLSEKDKTLLAMLAALVFYRSYGVNAKKYGNIFENKTYRDLSNCLVNISKVYKLVESSLEQQIRISSLNGDNTHRSDRALIVRGVSIHQNEGLTRTEIAALMLCEDENCVIQHFVEGAKFAKACNKEMFLIEPGAGTHGYADRLDPPNTVECSSQERTSADSEVGQSYMTNGVLVYSKKPHPAEDSLYYFMGEANYVKHDGDKPMQIMWKTVWDF